jgi:hypothetical protein
MQIYLGVFKGNVKLALLEVDFPDVTIFVSRNQFKQ